MLSIKPIGCSSQEVNYYTNLGEAEQQDYYSEDGTRPGSWWGRGARYFGLSGSVTPEELSHLLEGRSPDGGEQLVQVRKAGQVKRRAGFDLTFSPPKSFSVLWSQVDDRLRKELDRIAERAILATVDAVEEICGSTRRSKNGTERQSAKMIAAIFSHDTARGTPGEAPDPNRHFHIVIPNVVVRPDGTTGALDARPLFQKRMKMALGALFRAELSKNLAELGIATARARKPHRDELASWFEIKGVPKTAIEAMSKRRRQIQEWLDRNGKSGAKAAEQAALQTRSGKHRYSEDELFQAWQQSGREVGFGPDQANGLFNTTRDPSFDVPQQSQAVIEIALAELTSKKARFTEVELLEGAAVAAQCRGLGIQEVRESVAKCLGCSKEIVRLKDEQGIPTFTTRAMLALERKMLDGASELAGRMSHPVLHSRINRTLAAHPTIRREQAEAVRHLTSGSDISCVCGVAGSGKTFLLSVAREVWESEGLEVIGTSLAAKASRGLETGAGIRSLHVHRLLNQIEKGELAVDNKTVLVVDEAGMIGTRQMEKLVTLARTHGAKLALVGDWRQLQAIDAGAAFRGIAEQVGYTSVKQIIRQREEWSRKVVENLRDGRSLKALLELERRGGLFVGRDRNEAIDRLVSDWRKQSTQHEAADHALVFAGTQLDVRELNLRIQATRRQLGQLGDRSVEIDEVEFCERDRVMITRNHRPSCLENGQVGTVARVEGPLLSVEMDSGLTIEIDTTTFDAIALGYAMTAHKGQGVTCEHAFILTGDGMTDRELSYVEGSRARGVTRFYSDETKGSGSILELAALMNRSRQKELAYEHVIESG